jgi:hypothetical protein
LIPKYPPATVLIDAVPLGKVLLIISMKQKSKILGNDKLPSTFQTLVFPMFRSVDEIFPNIPHADVKLPIKSHTDPGSMFVDNDKSAANTHEMFRVF